MGFLWVLLVSLLFSGVSPASVPCLGLSKLARQLEGVNHLAPANQEKSYQAAKQRIKAIQKREAELGVAETYRTKLHDYGSRTKISVVLVHGVGETPARMEHLAQIYHELGANVINVRLSGHGIKPEALHEATLEDWRGDLDEALQVGKLLGEKVVLAGFSLGGALATDAAFRHPGEVDSLSLHSPALRMRKGVAKMVDPLWLAYQQRPTPENSWTKASKGPDDFDEHGRYSRTSVAAFPQLRRLTADLESNWTQTQLGVPVRIVTAGKDERVDGKAIADFAEKQENVSTLSIEGVRHAGSLPEKEEEAAFGTEAAKEHLLPVYIELHGLTPR